MVCDISQSRTSIEPVWHGGDRNNYKSVCAIYKNVKRCWLMHLVDHCWSIHHALRILSKWCSNIPIAAKILWQDTCAKRTYQVEKYGLHSLISSQSVDLISILHSWTWLNSIDHLICPHICLRIYDPNLNYEGHSCINAWLVSQQLVPQY